MSNIQRFQALQYQHNPSLERFRKQASAGSAAKPLADTLKSIGLKGLSQGAGAIATAALIKPIVQRLEQRLAPRKSLFNSIMGDRGPFRTALGYGLAGAGLAAGAGGAAAAYDKITTPRRQRIAKEMMYSQYPSLKAEDARVVNRSFDTLWRFNRDLAEDPTTAGAFVRRAVHFREEGIQPSDIKTLTEIRKNVADTHSKTPGFTDHARFLSAFRERD